MTISVFASQDRYIKMISESDIYYVFLACILDNGWKVDFVNIFRGKLFNRSKFPLGDTTLSKAGTH